MAVSEERLAETSRSFWSAKDGRDNWGQIVTDLPEADVQVALSIMAKDGATIMKGWLDKGVPVEQAAQKIIEIWVRLLVLGKQDINWGLNILLNGFWEIFTDWRSSENAGNYPKALLKEKAVELLKIARNCLAEDKYPDQDYNRMSLSLGITNYPFMGV